MRDDRDEFAEFVSDGVQARAELVGGGPDDGATVEIGVVEELASYVTRHTRRAVHYYSLRRESGRWVYRWHCFMQRGASR